MDLIYYLLIYAGIAMVFMYGIPTLIERLRGRKWKRMYDSVQIGDRYIQKLREPNPFEKQWGSVITITDKAMNEHGVPYVKYLDGYVEHSEDLSFLMKTLHYEPYNNQDKKQ